MTAPPAASPHAPERAAVSARTLRALLRSRRRGRPAATTVAGRIYEGLLYALVPGGLLVQAVLAALDWSRASGSLADPAATGRPAVAAVLICLGLAVRAAAELGPLSVSSTNMTWLFSTPVDRGALLSRRFAATTAAAAALSTALVFGAALAVGIADVDLLWSAVLGASVGVIALSLAVVAQRHRRGPARVARVGMLLAALGGVLAVAAILTTTSTMPLPTPPTPPVAVLAVPALLAAAWSLLAARRATSGIDRGALNEAAEVSGAVRVSVGWLDTSLIADLLEQRRWRRRAVVRSSRLTGRGVATLVRAELRRVLRRRASIGWWAALGLLPYVTAALLPPFWTMPATLVIGYLALGRLSSGLRLTARSAALRRTLPFSDAAIRRTMLVVPAVAALVWGAAVAPAVAGSPWAGTAVTLALVGLAGVLRSAKRPPIDYHTGGTLDPISGAVPVALLVQVFSGPDLVVVAAVLWAAGIGLPFAALLASAAIAWSLWQDHRSTPAA
ncbi:FtsH-binding integral membrane protein [Actinoalloteichus hoggarensis]|uniref:Uncharacterized protein n=1 Tax=Actinoalloteichus hoggarensis TaxID=1470176 RepID=A0A221W6S0_9PSEU|nr:DUF6297 family protein [Actinoalloteichus hoggarensis]ASO21363.1 hypothetical protein AHOG_18690 [Actinoalloteichus hoggarensis]MBB5921296.1 FtsH-binding integral membrane protein [Actinoalloteichus hoggarensis]